MIILLKAQSFDIVLLMLFVSLTCITHVLYTVNGWIILYGYPTMLVHLCCPITAVIFTMLKKCTNRGRIQCCFCTCSIHGVPLWNFAWREPWELSIPTFQESSVWRREHHSFLGLGGCMAMWARMLPGDAHFMFIKDAILGPSIANAAIKWMHCKMYPVST